MGMEGTGSLDARHGVGARGRTQAGPPTEQEKKKKDAGSLAYSFSLFCLGEGGPAQPATLQGTVEALWLPSATAGRRCHA